ncbi:uncharacterized protein N0V89_005509 [Didymosphaeria variabile]|uniref:Uncharacterized protein n=1 Tax=Didymosphaeria variabile TaxID=1932322 RepID=A0A9W8XLL0_9PLEO|nr:uncharacterized protein N0V89_005509 [Didymosphaeria variabile]KAJ4353779.1 hypothetical protein N0V89_005509 [Didymosphaeria variabile]
MEDVKVVTKIAADGLSAEQKQRLHEVADELASIYKTLVDMRYIHPNALNLGPHELDDKSLAGYEKCGLDPAIIYLYSIMPYIDEIETDARDFFQGGAFFNQTSIRDVQRGRDPRYLSPQGGSDDEEGQYMYPWYTPLSNCGNHSPIIIYDAREHRIWIVDQIEGNTTDPAYCKGWYGESDGAKDEESNWGDSGSSDWSGASSGEDLMDFSDGASEGSSEFWDDEDDLGETRECDAMVEDQSEVIEYDEGFEHVEELQEWERQEAAAVKNRNSLEPVRSRPAGDVLRDINSLYRALKELPGQGEYNSGWMEPAVLKPLYLKNGWPDNFNGDQFEVDVARAYATERARYDAEGPLREVKCYEGWSEHSDRDVEEHKKEISEAQTPDDEWMARFKLWKAQERSERNERDLRNAKKKAEDMCPDGICQKDEDLPLWQLEKLRVETQWKQESVKRTDHVNLADQFKDNPDQIRSMEASHRRAQRQLDVYDQAFAASKAEAERLCPGRTFQEATGIKSLGRRDTLASIASQREVIEYYERYIQCVRDFAETVPQDAPVAVAAVENEIKEIEKPLKSSREGLKRTETWLAEHGNTD